jgi:hypothetical protein
MKMRVERYIVDETEFVNHCFEGEKIAMGRHTRKKERRMGG